MEQGDRLQLERLIGQNTEKLQEILDELKERRGILEQADAEFKENVLDWLQKLHQQGQP